MILKSIQKIKFFSDTFNNQHPGNESEYSNISLIEQSNSNKAINNNDNIDEKYFENLLLFLIYNIVIFIVVFF